MNPFLPDFELNKQAFAQESHTDLEIRRKRISRVLTMLNENEENLCKVIHADFGFRQPVETQFAEILAIRQAASHALKNLNQWAKPVSVKTPTQLKPSKSYLMPQAKGVVGIMSPWNYPLSLALVPAISAFAAGNMVWLKPSERSARTSGYLASLVQQYFHPTEFYVVNGGPQVAEHFANIPFDHLLFTGSTQTGQLVAKAAAENLTPLTLELGGKSPLVIDSSASISDCASRILYGKLFNAGQTCIAPDYILVPHQLQTQLIDALQSTFQVMYPDPLTITHAIDERQQQRWQSLINDARDKGAQIIPLGTAMNHVDGFTPTLILNANSTTRVMSEEIFGPLLPIIGYDQASDVNDFINARPHPLAAYWFGSHQGRLKGFLENTQAGGVTVNDTLLHYANENLPFGGVGQSGMGSYHGKYGFDTFTHFKPVFQMRSLFGIRALGGSKMVHPPYGPKVAKIMKMMGKK
jgi:coniferyl-aldehyde dehydrogenase